MCVMPLPRYLLISNTIATDHLAQLIFLGEFTAKGVEVGNEQLAGVDQGFLRGALAIGLDAELEAGKEGVGNCADKD